MSNQMGTAILPARGSTHGAGWHEGDRQDYLRDLVYRANDGIIAFAVAGVAGGALSGRAVLIVGAANLFADGLSMGVGNYLGIRSQESAREEEAIPFATGWRRSSHSCWLGRFHFSLRRDAARWYRCRRRRPRRRSSVSASAVPGDHRSVVFGRIGNARPWCVGGGRCVCQRCGRRYRLR